VAVEVSDIETALGRSLTVAEQAQATLWIADALLLIGARLGDTAELDQDVLDYVVREAVVARFRNPDGYQSETIDDYTYRHGTETRRVTILDEWWDLLSPSVATAAFTITPYGEPGYSTEPDYWVTPTEQA
jgi:hypothetical protein